MVAVQRDASSRAVGSELHIHLRHLADQCRWPVAVPDELQAQTDSATQRVSEARLRNIPSWAGAHTRERKRSGRDPSLSREIECQNVQRAARLRLIAFGSGDKVVVHGIGRASSKQGSELEIHNCL